MTKLSTNNHDIAAMNNNDGSAAWSHEHGDMCTCEVKIMNIISKVHILIHSPGHSAHN